MVSNFYFCFCNFKVFKVKVIIEFSVTASQSKRKHKIFIRKKIDGFLTVFDNASGLCQLNTNNSSAQSLMILQNNWPLNLLITAVSCTINFIQNPNKYKTNYCFMWLTLTIYKCNSQQQVIPGVNKKNWCVLRREEVWPLELMGHC